ncbi:hypothetical protein ASG43_19115 [Aureimonas sp. Leaf454]|uniref:hypothetical protein n=1 Tax=Aureimonas sp. Leaf454 TaxID=1736381 RepID=UPI0006FF14E7|nr:hypothetical protein [Aureimonas sp. Leaf454]KQT53099.1 hypothetical protein ASG43_19115 [Aureimonas sp. Leaf454]
MWKVLGASSLLMLAVLAGPAGAEDILYVDRGDNAFNLPGVTLPQGQDEVHAADGTTCRSAVGGTGTYLDVGAIKGNLRSSSNVATYARVVIPLGRQTSRLDCARLYELEVERLKMELSLLKMGLPSGGAPAKEGETRDAGLWMKEGWSDDGRAGTAN